MFDFFLSYNRADKDWTRGLAEALRRRSANIFFDEDSIKIGDDIVSTISRALESSKHVVLILSPRSVSSEWVELEWASSLNADPAAASRRLLPILIEKCDVPPVLRRLKYFNACERSIDECAETLMASILSVTEGFTSAVSMQRSRIAVSTPVLFPKYYLERKADQLMVDAFGYWRGCFIYGPRMIGKTSLLRRQWDRARLVGMHHIWIDLSMPAGDIVRFFLKTTIRSLRPREAVRANIDISDLWHETVESLAEFAVRSEAKEVLLLLDEVDCALGSDEGPSFEAALRAMVTHPDLQSLNIVVAGFTPPWLWSQDIRFGSPFWNALRDIPMSHFSEHQVVTFLAGLGVDQASAKHVFEYTGGNPPQIMSVANALEQGAKLPDILRDPFSVHGPFISWLQLVSMSAKRILDSREPLATALLRGEQIPDRMDRLTLWRYGLIRDPDANPPQVLGEQVFEIVRQLGFKK